MQLRPVPIAMLLLMLGPVVQAQTVRAVSLEVARPAPSGQTTGPSRTLFDEYCIACHSDRLRQGDLSLEGVDPGLPGSGTNAAVLEKVIRKLRAGLMPPPGRPRPDKARVNAFVDNLEETIDRAAAAGQRTRLGFQKLTENADDLVQANAHIRVPLDLP